MSVPVEPIEQLSSGEKGLIAAELVHLAADLAIAEQVLRSFIKDETDGLVVEELRQALLLGGLDADHVLRAAGISP
jgi:hypothetical protein